MTATGKTKDLLRLDLPLGQLQPNDSNPNKMKDREFDLLCDNIEKTGLTDPILVRPLDYTRVHDLAMAIKDPGELVDALVSADTKFRIVGGHHRYNAATFLGFQRVPCTVIMDPEFDQEQETFQLVRMNMIKGHLDPAKFFEIVNSMNDAYTDEVLQEAFGFADEAQWRQIVDQAAQTLPDAKTKKKFKEAAEEVKTIDELSKLLNSMFTKYGDTLPYGYMVVDYGGKKSVWVRASKKTMDALDLLGDQCIESSVSMDALLGGILSEMAKGGLSEQLEDIIKKAPKVEIPKGMGANPTEDNIAKAASL